MIRIFLSFLLVLILTISAIVYGDFNLGSLFTGKEAAKVSFIAIDSKHKPGRLSYNSVKPVLDNRCATCHSGVDAPCQLLLSSYEGLQRGASKQPLYETRWQAIPPSRLLIDGKTPDDWRKQGFFPVLNEKSQFPEINLNNSLLAKFLVLKRDQPVSNPANTVKRDDKCPTLEEFTGFAQNHPWAGMPYGLTGLDKAEQEKLMNWLQDGAKNSPPAAALSEPALIEIGKWEQFLNDSALPVQLTARYVYEHLFSAHLHFKGQPANEFYRLVRSKTPTGQAIEELDSLYPYAAPATSVFYYRLNPVTDTLMDKTHAVYELSDSKMARIKELFLKPETTVAQLPAYSQESPQPFSTFKDLPIDARYQFLLDDAQYFFSAMFKSPALNHHDGISGLRDQFWIVFYKPRADLNAQTERFLSDNTRFLALPTATQSTGGIAQWFELKTAQKQYLANKLTFNQTVVLKNQALDMNVLWNGDGSNGNALLTVFRHDDHASVVMGLHGKTPSTAWVISYPLFERLHYLLSAGFSVYSNTAHHLNTRLALDLLRSEAENDYLQFLPKSARQAVHTSWYPDTESQWLGVFNTPDFAALAESAITYQSQDYPSEFFSQFPKINAPMPPALPANIPVTPAQAPLATPCPKEPCETTVTTTPLAPIVAPDAIAVLPDYDNFARQLGELSGPDIAALPELAFLRIVTATNPSQNAVYTLIRNRQLRHVGVLFGEIHRRQPELDTLTVLPGMVGSYPNQFFSITSDQLEAFITQLKQAKTETAVAKFLQTFGVSRDDLQFWAIYDSFIAQHRNGQPENAGLFDLSRYGKW